VSHLTRELVRPVVWSVRGEFGRGRFAPGFRRRRLLLDRLFLGCLGYTGVGCAVLICERARYTETWATPHA